MLLAGCASDSPVLPYALEIGDEGVGVFHPGDPYDPKALAAKAVGFDVEKVSQVNPSDPQTILLLKRGSHTVLYLSSDESGEAIGSITVLSPQIADAKGQKVGDPIRNDPTLRCTEETCRYTAHPAIVYRLDHERRIREITVQRL